MITSPVVPSSLTQSPVSIIENTSVSGGKSVTAGISDAAVATPQRESMLEKIHPAGENPATAAE